MHKGAILAGLVTATMLAGSGAQSAEDRNRPKCDFHVFADSNDHWALTEGSPKRRWLVMNVGDASVLVTGSEITTPGQPEHVEMIATGESTIATMKYGQPEIHLAAIAPAANAGTTNATSSATPAATSASTSPDAANTTSADTTTATETAPASASTEPGANTMAAGEPPPATKTTVVICRFFERRR